MDHDTPAAEQLRVRCACGWEAHGTQQQLITTATEHGLRLHNMEPTPDQILAMLTRD